MALRIGTSFSETLLRKPRPEEFRLVSFLFAQSILTHHDVGIFSSGFLFGFLPAVHKGLSYSVRQGGIINVKYQPRVD